MPTLSLNQVTISVSNIASAFSFYQGLGLHPIVKSPHYARFIVPGNEVTLSIHLTETVGSSTTVYFETPDLDAVVSDLKQKGFHFSQEPTDQRWGWREAYLPDLDGNSICLYHAGSVRMNPDWRIPESKDRHLLTATYFQDWLMRYKAAWESRSPAKASELFSRDIHYHETPFDPPSVGIEGILVYWEQVPQTQEQISFDFDILHVYNNIGYCKWRASFVRIASQKGVQLDGIFEVEFDATGKCQVFREWWHRKEE